MHFDEVDEGDYRIYAGAMEAGIGRGYTAAVVITRWRGIPHPPREAFRDISVAGGHCWPTPSAALSFAVAKAQELIRTERERLAH